MRFFLLFFFGWFISDSMGNDLDFDYTQKGNFGSYTVKGRLSDPSYKNDYVYLRYLSNILYQEFLNQIDGADFMASLNDWNEKFTEYNKSCLISQVTRRMSFIMLGAGSGIKSRPLDQINPEHFWQPIQAIRLMMASARKAEFHFGFKDWFIRMHGAAKDHIKKHNVDDAAYERHIKILTAIGVATEAAYYSQADDITHDVKEAVKKVIKDDEALLTKVYQYLEHYGLFEKEIMPFSKQIERVGDFMTFRKKHHEPARLAIGVSNLLKDSQEMGEERQRFKDPSWIPVNVRKDFFNPAGIPYLVMDAGSTKAWDNEIKPLRDKSFCFA